MADSEQAQSMTSRGQGSSLDENTRLEYLSAMGIQPWFEKSPHVSPPQAEVIEPAVVEAAAEPDSTSVIEPGSDASSISIGDMDWNQLQQTVSGCQLCELHTSRTQTVFGVGNQNADLLIVGEAPGADEDRLGEPFVGRAGKLLDAMMAAIQLDRSQIYIANVLKCRPPNNRNPHTSEIICCDAYLQRQIELIQPKLILALGRIAAHHLLVSQDSLGKLRKQVHRYNGIPLIVSYHPAYLLRTPVDKRKSWQDLLQVNKLLHN
jgi:DNA polymerase